MTTAVRSAGSVFDVDKRDAVRWIRAQRARTVALLEDLTEDQWETIVLPGWRVREVAAHLVSTDEAALTGRLLLLGMRAVPVSELEAWNESQVGRWADRPVEEILRGLSRWGGRIGTLLGVPPGPLASGAFPTPFGRVSLLWLGMQRVYDEWIHLEDVRRTFGWPADDAPEVIEPVGRQLLAGIPHQTLPRLPANLKGAVRLSFDDVDLPPVGFDLASRRYGFSVSGAESTIEGSAAALAMIAAGRDAWRKVEEEGSLRIEGEREPAETFLDALLLV